MEFVKGESRFKKSTTDRLYELTNNFEIVVEIIGKKIVDKLVDHYGTPLGVINSDNTNLIDDELDEVSSNNFTFL